MPVSSLPQPSSALSTQRIASLSVALTIHLIAFGVLLRPPGVLALVSSSNTPEQLVVEWIAQVVPPQIPIPPPPQAPMRPATPKPSAAPRAVVPPSASAESDFSVPEGRVLPTPSAAGPAVEPELAPVSRGAQIAYDTAPPPPYPPQARRRGWQGEVLLRVRVDPQGRPEEVEVERSSGHSALDRSAREHVLRHWRFQPALQQGQPVTAWAVVPIQFRIESG